MYFMIEINNFKEQEQQANENITLVLSNDRRKEISKRIQEIVREVRE
jgi:hypothetical protein